jgi:hypothetical protein
LTAICTEALLAVLDTLAKPKPETDGAKDPRSAGQRNHDAVQDAMLMLLRSNLVPDSNGVAATIVFTMTPEQFQSGGGFHHREHPHLAGFKESSQHLIDRRGVVDDAEEADPSEVGVAGSAAGAA